VFQKIKKSVVVTVAGFALVSPVALATSASATPVEPASVVQVSNVVSVKDTNGGVALTDLEVQPRVIDGRVGLAVKVESADTVAADVKFITPYGEKSFKGAEQVQPGTNAYQTFNTREEAIAAGTVTISAYVPASNGQLARHTVVVLSYGAFSARPADQVDVTPVVETRVLAGKVFVAVKVTNNETVPVDIRITTPYGEVKRDKVQPGASASQSFATRSTEIAAGTVTVGAYLWDGFGHHQVRTVDYDAFAVAAS